MGRYMTYASIGDDVPEAIPELDNKVWVVAFCGEITSRTFVDVRGTVGKVLAEGPGAIVVDLHGCRIDPRLSLIFLPTLQHLAGKAGSRLLYTVDEDLADRLSRDPVRNFVEVYPTVWQAKAAALAPSTQRWFHLRLPAGRTASAEARRQVGSACAAWGLSPMVGRVRAILSELMDNAVQHGAARVEVTVTELHGLLHVRVRDYSPFLPDDDARSRAAPAVESGRSGLPLSVVGRHAMSCGVRLTDGGKIVWATMWIGPDDRRAPESHATNGDIDDGSHTRLS